MIVSAIFILFGFFLLVKGADLLVEGSSKLAKKFHIPEMIIGLTVVSIGTSLPELFISLTSAMNGYSDMAIGNVIGSNICNLFLILGISTTIRSLEFKRETKLIEVPMCLGVTILFLLFCNTSFGITRVDAIILLFLFLLFIAYTIYMGIHGKTFDGEVETKKEIRASKKIPGLKNLVYIFLGAIGLKIGGDLTVDNAVIIAQQFNLSEHIISLTILAIGTSLPELVTGVMAAIKGNSDIAIGNILGSNIFNMLLIIGTTALVKPISYNFAYNLEFIILISGLFLLALFPIIPPKNKMSRTNGMLYILIYFIHLTVLVFL